MSSWWLTESLLIGEVLLVGRVITTCLLLLWRQMLFVAVKISESVCSGLIERDPEEAEVKCEVASD